MDIVVTGAGICGLTTAMMLASDGHEVTVLERDPAPVPEPEDAWDDWERRGVNQFRLPHFFGPRFRSIIESEFPALASALVDAGMLHFNFMDLIPDEMTGGKRPGDDQYALVTGRRSVFESVIAAFADELDHLTVRRATAVDGLVTGAGVSGPGASGSVPHVTGVMTSTGETVAADLVVDATGRRSPLPHWLTEIGARAPREELEDCGFTYYGRHFRSKDGSLPVSIGPPVQQYGSITVLLLPADNGTWSTTLVSSSRDEAMRAVRDIDRWTETVQSLPLAAHWLDGIPIEDRIISISKIEDRHREFADKQGRPLATGVIAVADSWACTNPSLGRGASIGAMHAVALRDLLRTGIADDPHEFVSAWNEVTSDVVEPWYRSTLSFDRHRLNEVHAEIEGQRYDPKDDPSWVVTQALGAAGGKDGDCLRANLSVAGVLKTPDEVFTEPGLLDKVMELGGDYADAPTLGPDRKQLVAIVTG
jgi:2-polyprenyl-6-methoxyphenol hydroxylase-like FAD-dependent oxidoreductase